MYVWSVGDPDWLPLAFTALYSEILVFAAGWATYYRPEDWAQYQVLMESLSFKDRVCLLYNEKVNNKENIFQSGWTSERLRESNKREGIVLWLIFSSFHPSIDHFVLSFMLVSDFPK